MYRKEWKELLRSGRSARNKRRQVSASPYRPVMRIGPGRAEQRTQVPNAPIRFTNGAVFTDASPPTTYTSSPIQADFEYLDYFANLE